jgi:putative flavoprotein involved in K+ transport
MSERSDVLVIGGGQAGLAMGYHLSRLGKRFEIVDAGTGIGEAWRSRWDSLILFTPSQYDSLPGMAFPAPHDTYPGKDDVADYLATYVAKLELPVRLNTRISSLTSVAGGYVATAGNEKFEAKQVVVATGPFQVPFVPPISSSFDRDVFQVHSVDYRNPVTVPSGKVLVVGGANSGCQIARELSASHTVELSVGEKLPTVPQRPLGRDVWWWASGLGLATRVTVDSRLGKRLAHRDQVIGEGPKQLARKYGVGIRPRGVSASGRTMTFADGTSSDFDAVVWTTGFRLDHSWIDVPEVKDEKGNVRHERGVTAAAGLYMLGLPWQHTRASALLGWVAADAAFVAERIGRIDPSTTGGADE